MKYKYFLWALALFFSLDTFSQNVTKVHQNTILIDTHGDVMSRQIKSGFDLAKEHPYYDFDLVKAKKGGLKAQVFSIWGDESVNYNHALREIDSLDALIKRHPDKIALATTAKEVRNLVKKGKFVAMIGVEGGHMIDDDLNKINELAKRGMIYLTLTWNNSTQWASSAVDERTHKITDRALGLNDFGKKVVQRLNELGVMVDLSHVGEQTFYDAIKITTKPVILSHSCAYEINPVPRNLTDEQILAVGKNGGVICLNFYNGFVDASYKSAYDAFMKKHKDEYQELEKQGVELPEKVLSKKYQEEFDKIKPSIDKLVDHLDRIVKLIGIDYVGIGADYDGASSYPKGLDNVSDYPKLTEVLLKRGYSAKDIQKIYGENFLRVFKANVGK